MQREASITIVIVTAVYLLYNLPVFINYILYTIASFHSEIDYVDIYSTELLYFYSWVFTYIICVACNALTNPLIYFFRMKGYRRYLRGLIGQRVLSRRGNGSRSIAEFVSSRKDINVKSDDVQMKGERK